MKGNTRLKIYQGSVKKGGVPYPFFTVTYYEGWQRQRRAFGSLDKAITEAGKIVDRLEQGKRDALKLTNSGQ